MKLFKYNPEFLRVFVTVDGTSPPLFFTKDQSKDKAVDFTRQTSSEEEDCPNEREGDVHRFLGFTRRDLHRSP